MLQSGHMLFKEVKVVPVTLGVSSEMREAKTYCIRSTVIFFKQKMMF